MSTPQTTEDKRALNKRLETICWGVFLVMLGALAIGPKTVAKDNIGSIGVGLILLGLNAARYYFKIKTSTGTIILGIIALASGVGDLLGVELPVIEILLIAAGINIIYKVIVGQRDKQAPGS
jgi:hypothetical protein